MAGIKVIAHFALSAKREMLAVGVTIINQSDSEGRREKLCGR